MTSSDILDRVRGILIKYKYDLVGKEFPLDLYLNSIQLTFVPWHLFQELGIERITGNLDLSNNQIRTMESECDYRPVIESSLYINHNFLTNFKGCPPIIGYDIHAENNLLENLVGSPPEIRNMILGSNGDTLISLEGTPVHIELLSCCLSKEIMNQWSHWINKRQMEIAFKEKLKKTP